MDLLDVSTKKVIQMMSKNLCIFWGTKPPNLGILINCPTEYFQNKSNSFKKNIEPPVIIRNEKTWRLIATPNLF